MKIELKDFQKDAASTMYEDVQDARAEIRRDRLQAVTLSSPTGSGKTITLTALLEYVTNGFEEFTGNPEASFLWFSDSPELNAQSLEKIATMSTLFPRHKLVLVDADFDQETFDKGYIYFLNTQKLSRKSLLVQKGDERDFTIWETISNTIKRSPADFILVIDEAHRGMTTARDINEAQTIVQKFILGSTGEIPPVPFIIGMSATLKRFTDLIGGRRVHRPTEIDVQKVRASGLLKDRIILHHPDRSQPSDYTLLQAAASKLRVFEERWQNYCARQKEKPIRPILVVQVEDGNGAQITKTKLSDAITAIERSLGTISPDEFAHSFQEDAAVDAGHVKLRKIDASAINADPWVRVVFFKTALTTGWDCPRAEVMMSFRKAVDHTLIAQLVGRMVRTPFARRIDDDETLNDVALYLPHYDQKGLQAIIQKLRDPDPEFNVGVDVEDESESVICNRAPASNDIFAHLETLPSYVIEKTFKANALKRLMRLARYLSIDKISEEARDEAVDCIVDVLTAERDRLKKTKGFISDILESGMVGVRAVTIAYGEFKELGSETTKIPVSPENVAQLFERCGRLLAPGEGLHDEYWMRTVDKENPDIARLELHVILQSDETWRTLERAAQQEFQDLYNEHKAAIHKLPSAKQERYKKLIGSQSDPGEFTLHFPETITVPISENRLERHLYQEENGTFGVRLNSWETSVLEEQLKSSDTIFWLRNIARRDWALCVPYQFRGEWKPFYPDFLTIKKRTSTNFAISIFEPHDPSRDDSWAKAKGLAEYAEKHGQYFDRIEFIALDKKIIKRLNVNDLSTRRKIKRITSNEELNNLLAEL